MQLGTELGRIAAGRSEVTADPRDRRFSDPAWKDNPFLRRSVQAYLAAGKSAEELVAGAGLGWRDDTRIRFLLTNLIAAAAPSNNPLLSPAGLKARLIWSSTIFRCRASARPKKCSTAARATVHAASRPM